MGMIGCASWVKGWAFGLLARILERSGRDARGIGGGTPSGSVAESTGSFLPPVEPCSWNLLNVDGIFDFDNIGGICVGGSFLRPSPGRSF